MHGTSIPYLPPRYSNIALMTSQLEFDLISPRLQTIEILRLQTIEILQQEDKIP